MKSIEVKYFAMLKDKTHIESEKMNVAHATYLDLYLDLKNKYQFEIPASMLQVAVNDRFVSINDPIQEDAKIVFIPPVAGG